MTTTVEELEETSVELSMFDLGDSDFIEALAAVRNAVADCASATADAYGVNSLHWRRRHALILAAVENQWQVSVAEAAKVNAT